MAKDIEVDLKVNASQGTKALEKFGLTAEQLEKEDLIPLNFAIGELEDRLYEMANAGDTSSATFKQMSAEVGRMKKTIIETDLAIDGMAQTTAQTVGGSLQGLASGFEFAQGAMGAFGVSGEAVEESLLKVQSAMAMAQGIQGLKEGMIAFKALKQSIMGATVVQKVLNFVMNLNPIGLIIAGVVALGAAFAALAGPIQDFIFWIMGVEEAEETAGEARKRRAKEEQTRTKAIRREHELSEKARKRAFDAEQSAMDDQIRLLQAQGKDVTHLQKLKTEASIQNLKETLLGIESQYDWMTAIVETGEASGVLLKATSDAQKEVIEENKTAAAELRSEIESLETDLKIIDIEAGKRGKERAEEAKKTNADKLAKIAEQEAEARKIADELQQQTWDLEDAQFKMLDELKSTKRENEIAKLVEDYETKFELAQGNADLELALEESQKEKIAEINAKYRKIEEDAEQEAKDKKKADDKEDLEDELANKEAIFGMASNSFGAIGELATAFASDNEKSQKKAFQVNKAVQMAQAVISTYQGANAIFAAAALNPSTVAFPAQPFIMAGAAIASGLANVATIAKTKFQGGGSSGGGGGGGSAPSLPSASSPTFNVIGDSGTNQLAETLGGPQKAYVVSGDVTSAQSLDRNKIENASI